MKPIYSFIGMLLVGFSSFAKEENLRTEAPGFHENKGQLIDQNHQKRNDILYYGSTQEMSYFLKQNGVSYQLYKKAEKTDDVTIQRIDISWLGANVNARVEATGKQKAFENFYNTADGKEILNVHSFEKVIYNDIYTGIDAKYYHQNSVLKYDYIIAPYADYKQISFKIEGADKIVLNEDGTVTLKTPLGDIKEGKPVAYQNGRKVEANWVLQEDVLSFQLGHYDVSKEVVIDPLVYLWNTLVGTNVANSYNVSKYATGDKYGNNYVLALIGFTSNPHYLFKYNSSGGVMWQKQVLGNRCITDTFGNLYVSGSIPLTNNIVTTGAHQVAFGGGVSDGFLIKYDSSGTMIWGTYYGGSGNDTISLCKADKFANIYISGNTTSSNNISTVGSYQYIYQGLNDGFIAKFDQNGMRKWGTYYGGTAKDAINSLDVNNGSIAICGITYSSSGISISGAHQPSLSGANYNAFLALFDTSGTISWSTYYGDDSTSANDCIIDDSGNIFLCGTTKATINISTSNVHQSSNLGLSDAYLVKFNISGIRQWGTYYGGSNYDGAKQCIKTGGHIFVLGNTSSSTNIAFPKYYSPYTNQTGFVAEFDNLGQRLTGRYIGGYSYSGSPNCYIYISDVVNAYSNGVNDVYIPFNIYEKIGCLTNVKHTSYLFKYSICNSITSPNITTSSTTFCQGSTVQLSTTASSSFFKWYRNDTALTPVGASNIFLASLPGKYNLLLDSGGCVSFLSNAIILTELPLPQTSVSKNDLPCYGPSIGAAITITASGSTPPYFYNWDNSNNTTNSHTNLPLGTYISHVTDANGCVKSDTTTILRTLEKQPYNSIIQKDVPCYGASLGYISLSTSHGTPPYHYTWANRPDTTPTISNLGTGVYYVTTTDSINCIQVDSIIINQETTTPPSTPLAEICAVTVDSATGKNLIIWEKQGNVRAKNYNIYTEGSTSGQYNLIGTNSVTQFSTYLDNSSNPLQQSYLYKISEVDSCNYENALSNHHKTIHLTANLGINGEVNLSWNQYEGRPYSTHYIMRSFNGVPFTLLNQVSATITSYSDLTPPTGTKVYRIDVDLPTGCNPQKTTAYNFISSNAVRLGDSSISHKTDIQITPNPTTGVITISGTKPAIVKLFNAVGKLVFEKKETNQLDLTQYPPAIYLIRLYNEKGEVYHHQKLVKN